ncbi:hypothetical protein BP5796_12242 [Coleophoma crateriformis]|uniref:LysR family regulatory protein n=1 Tax=Coleophoma crateriformis TaxID=565419 RepID=A0A3D8Q900_9HELO|nr:hypothetical protein BP5796_12242 [Coleophoma crateriformis]
MTWFFRRKKPAVVPTDTIIPLHHFDDIPIFRRAIYDFTLRFDDVLNPDELSAALRRLMEIGNWRKLGARLRLNDQGKLEYHVPMAYDKERPGFSYSHVKHEGSIQNDPTAARIPKMTSNPSVQDSPEQFGCFVRRPDAPMKLHDYVLTDEPQLSLHVVSFADATLVSITWLHTSFDIMGQAALIDAWSLVLSGQEHRVIELHGYDFDPLATFGCSPISAEQSLLASHDVKGLHYILFALRFFSEILWWPKDELHTVCLPASYLHTMKEKALQELTTNETSKPFISDGDIICAWITRLSLQHLPSSSTRSVAITNVLDMRRFLSKDLLPQGTAYVSNAASLVQSLVPASQLFQKPLSFTALKVRQGIQEQATREQVEAFIAFQRENTTSSGDSTAPFGDSTSQLMLFTNWTKGNFYEVDFSSAVVKPGIPLEKRANRVGRPSYVQAVGHYDTKIPSRYAFIISGKDAAGNYWISGRLRTGTWRSIEKEFASARI